MNPSPQLHRSLTFWAGLLVILFTSWAWWDSYANISILSWNRLSALSGFRGIVIERYMSANSLELSTTRSQNKIPDPSAHEHFPLPFFVKAQEIELDYSAPPPPAHSRKESEQTSVNFAGPGSWSFYFPYWLITPPLVLIWTALLFLRARRRRRAITPPLSEGTS